MYVLGFFICLVFVCGCFLFFFLMEAQEVCYNSGTLISSHSSGFLGIFFQTFSHTGSLDLCFKRLVLSPKWVEEIIFV